MPSILPLRSPGEGDAVLIAAQSGRALAAAAVRAGLRPFVADLFGDIDTRTLAAGYRKLSGRFGAGIGPGILLRSLDELAHEAGRPLGLLLGSGFEPVPELIAELACRFRLLGCPADAVRTVKDPTRFSALLQEVGAPHPEIRRGPIDNASGWLVKRQGGSGGGHIRPARAVRLTPGCYLQRRVAGVPHSIAFLADGRQSCILAVTRQFTAPSTAKPFRFGGAVGPVSVPAGFLMQAGSAIEAIVARTGLRGLASADCLLDGDAWWLLEINPRPGATLDILDRGREPLLQAHIEASLGLLPEVAAPRGAAASEILYARRRIPVVPDIDWPGHVVDRPQPGSRISAGAPLCTVIASGMHAAQAMDSLAARVTSVRALLQEDSSHALPSPSAERQPLGRASRRRLCR
jgi:uncharacterized protein